MKNIRRLTVLILVLTMLVTGSGLSVFAESSEEFANNEDAVSAENNDAPDDEAVQADNAELRDENPTSGDDVTVNNGSDETAHSGNSSSAKTDKEKQVIRQTIEADVTGSDASVVLTGKMPEDASVAAEASDAEIEGFQTVTAYNITIYSDGEGSKSNEWEPESEIKVSIGDESLAEVVNGTSVDVYHIPENSDGSQAEPEFVCKASVKNGEVTFNADSFSVYVIVQGPEPYVIDTSVSGASDISEDQGYYFSIKRSNFTSYMTSNSGRDYNYQFYGDTNIDAAETWYFEAEQASGNYYIYRKNGEIKEYIYVTNNDHMSLSDTDKTLFTVEDTVNAAGTLYIYIVSSGVNYALSVRGNKDFFLEDRPNGENSNERVVLTQNETVPDDPFGLGGKSYGLMYYADGISATAMMAVPNNTNTLKGLSLLVRSDPIDKSRKLYVSKDSDMSFWTFEPVKEDLYYLKSDEKYLKVTTGSISLADEPDEYCRMQIIPGTGTDSGKIRLKGASASREIKLDGAIFKQVQNGGSFLNLAEQSVYSDEDFVTRTAYKVSVSDKTNVPSGKQVVIYSRVWNENDKRYQFYAIDHDGNLVQCYEYGDAIFWIGTEINTMLWEITDLPNSYYQLQNTYSEKYLAPKISDDGSIKVFTDSDDVNDRRINLRGRENGGYYTTILSWDDPHYDYACIRTQDFSRIVSGRMSQTEQFYFAIMDEPVEGPFDPHEVETVDHEKIGMTMKMIDFGKTPGSITNPSGTNTSKEQHNVIGYSVYDQNGQTSGLLSTDLDEYGYPVAEKTGKSLSELYAGDTQVNNLFIKSIYDSSGYFQFDSTENFAHLNQSDNKFEVYQELGTINGNGPTHTHGQFMPYNTLSSSGSSWADNKENLTDILGNKLDESNPRKYERLYDFEENALNYYFGMEISGSFMQTPSGKDSWGHDLIFDFVGDDDFWMYVDNELVIDLGGIHKALSASVNYSTGEVVINGSRTDLRSIFESNYKKRYQASHSGENPSDSEVSSYLDEHFSAGENVFKDYSTHTIRIFYMERGGGASNLRMRFNLATVEPDQVLLKKEVTGTDKDKYTSVKYPFQIFEKYEGESEYKRMGEKYIDHNDGDAVKYSVTYKNTSTSVEYRESYAADGYIYKDVFMLRPEQIAEIHFREGLDKYYIRECGIDSKMYRGVKVNGETIDPTDPAHFIGETDGVSVSGEAGDSRCYQTTEAKITDRAEVVFTNEIETDSLHTLTITKKLYDAGDNLLSKEDDATGFLMRIYLGKDENGRYEYYNQDEYYVKDPVGNYCKYVSGSGFVSLGKSDYENLTEAEKEAATFFTSPSGAVDKIPSQYSVEIRDVLVGTSFKVVEEDYDIPVGYAKKVWDGNEDYQGGEIKHYEGYARIGGSYELDGAENAGTIRGATDESNDARMEIRNVRGYGIRADKEWSDKNFISKHGDIYLAVYAGDSDYPLKNTIHRIDSYNTTRYFFDKLEEGKSFNDYQVYEVDVRLKDGQSGTLDDFINEYGYVTGDYGRNGPFAISKKLATDDAFDLEGNITSHGGEIVTKQYNVSYKTGTPVSSTGSGAVNIRTDTITNTAVGGLRILNTDLNGEPLSGATFVLRNTGTNEILGSFVSDRDGLVTMLYLEDGNYSLTETKSPAGYQALLSDPEPNAITIQINNGNYTLKVNGEIISEMATDTDTPCIYSADDAKLSIRNKQFTLNTVKKGIGNELLGGAHFALYREMQGNKDYYPIDGYSDVVSQDDGIINGITESLAAGTYYLTETHAPDGYILPSADNARNVRFTISPTGYVSIDDDYAGTLESVSGESTVYTISILNSKEDIVSPTGVTSRYLPYALIMMAGVMIGAVIYISKKRRDQSNDF